MPRNEMRPCPFCGRTATTLGISTSVRSYEYIDFGTPGERPCDATYFCQCGVMMRLRTKVYPESLVSDADLAKHAESLLVAKWNKRVACDD